MRSHYRRLNSFVTVWRGAGLKGVAVWLLKVECFGRLRSGD